LLNAQQIIWKQLRKFFNFFKDINRKYCLYNLYNFYIISTMPNLIHSTAIIDPTARLGENVTVGPFTIIGPECVLGDGCVKHPTKVSNSHLRVEYSVSL